MLCSRPIIDDGGEREVRDLSSGDRYFTHDYTDEVGKLEIKTSHMEEGGGDVKLVAVKLFVRLQAINKWFGTNYTDVEKHW